MIPSLYELFRALAQADSWTDDSPVDVDFLEALWPFGVPECWPTEPPTRQEMLIEITVPDGTTDDELDAIVIQHVLAADALHAAAGGSGLKVDTVEVYFA